MSEIPTEVLEDYRRATQRVDANQAIDSASEEQLRTALGLIVADSYLLSGADADRVLGRILDLEKAATS